MSLNLLFDGVSLILRSGGAQYSWPARSGKSEQRNFKYDTAQQKREELRTDPGRTILRDSGRVLGAGYPDRRLQCDPGHAVDGAARPRARLRRGGRDAGGGAAPPPAWGNERLSIHAEKSTKTTPRGFFIHGGTDWGSTAALTWTSHMPAFGKTFARSPPARRRSRSGCSTQRRRRARPEGGPPAASRRGRTIRPNWIRRDLDGAPGTGVERRADRLHRTAGAGRSGLLLQVLGQGDPTSSGEAKHITCSSLPRVSRRMLKGGFDAGEYDRPGWRRPRRRLGSGSARSAHGTGLVLLVAVEESLTRSSAVNCSASPRQ